MVVATGGGGPDPKEKYRTFEGEPGGGVNGMTCSVIVGRGT